MDEPCIGWPLGIDVAWMYHAVLQPADARALGLGLLLELAVAAEGREVPAAALLAQRLVPAAPLRRRLPVVDRRVSAQPRPDPAAVGEAGLLRGEVVHRVPAAGEVCREGPVEKDPPRRLKPRGRHALQLGKAWVDGEHRKRTSPAEV